MRPDLYKLVLRCVEDGIEHGWHRAHKHVENPTPEEIKLAIDKAVTDQLCEWFRFDEFDDGDTLR